LLDLEQPKPCRLPIVRLCRSCILHHSLGRRHGRVGPGRTKLGASARPVPDKRFSALPQKSRRASRHNKRAGSIAEAGSGESGVAQSPLSQSNLTREVSRSSKISSRLCLPVVACPHLRAGQLRPAGLRQAFPLGMRRGSTQPRRGGQSGMARMAVSNRYSGHRKGPGC
jgi:hypothetical protein